MSHFPSWLWWVVGGGWGVFSVWAIRRVGQPKASDRLVVRASLRGNAAPFPVAWRPGWLIETQEGLRWRPAYGVRRSVIALPAPTVRDVRAVKWRESLTLWFSWKVVRAFADQATYEVAVPSSKAPNVERA